LFYVEEESHKNTFELKIANDIQRQIE